MIYTKYGSCLNVGRFTSSVISLSTNAYPVIMFSSTSSDSESRRECKISFILGNSRCTLRNDFSIGSRFNRYSPIPEIHRVAQKHFWRGTGITNITLHDVGRSQGPGICRKVDDKVLLQSVVFF